MVSISAKNMYKLKTLLVFFSFFLVPFFGNTQTPPDKVLFLGNNNIPPYIYIQNGEPAGLVIDITNELARVSNLDMNIKATQWSEAQSKVLKGEADALLQINKNPQRELVYDFSEPLLESRFSIFHKSDHFQFMTIESLYGFTVGVEEKGYPAALIKKYPRIKVKIIPSWKTGFEMVKNEEIQAVIVDRWVGEYVLAINHIEGIAIVEEPVESSLSYIAVKKGNHELLNRINKGLRTLHAKGTMNEILDKWSQKEIVYFSKEQLIFYEIAILLGVISIILVIIILFFIFWNKKLHKEISRREQVEIELKKSRNSFLSLASNIPGITYRCKLDQSWTMLYLSDGVQQISGYPKEDFLNNKIRTFESIIHREDTRLVTQSIHEAVKARTSWEVEYRILCNDGSIRWVYEKGTSCIDHETKLPILEGVILDIQSRKQIELYQQLSTQVLLILNKSWDFESSLQRVLTTIKTITGCDAVGMRLKKGDDFPYLLEYGFSVDFLLTENSIIKKDEAGDICKNDDGSLRLDCICGLVISGQTDPQKSIYTKGGSAWFNDIGLLFLEPEKMGIDNEFRHRCLHWGYSSIALIPIRSRESITGLLQINFRKKDQFSPAIIELLEGVAYYIGEALKRKQVEDEKEILLQNVNERIKELNCLYGISRLGESTNSTIESIFQGTVDLIPHSYQFPLFTCARISFEDRDYLSSGFQETSWKQEAEIVINQVQVGILQVFYTKQFPASYEGPFSKEERHLIDELAIRLGTIIEQKKNVKLIAEKQMRISSILEGTNVGTWEWDIESGNIILNERWANMIGYTLEELSPVTIDTWRALIHPEDLEQADMLLEKHFSRGLEYFELESRILHKNGDWIWVLDRGKVARWTQEGNPLVMAGTHQDITERKETEAKIRHFATHDALTDLPSLRLAKDRVSMVVNLAKRNKKKAGLLFIDLDGFKPVNDRYGHDAGDALLKEIARRLLSCIRKTDTAARIGGDEFLIVLSELEAREDAARIAEKVISIVSKPFTFKNEKITVGCSIGISLYPDNGEDIEMLIKKADDGMYTIKKSGKNSYSFAT